MTTDKSILKGKLLRNLVTRTKKSKLEEKTPRQRSNAFRESIDNFFKKYPEVLDDH